MYYIRLRHLWSLRQLMVALTVAAFAVASSWPLEAQQNGSKFSIHDSGLSNGLRTVSKLFYQPILLRHFSKGWYAGLPDVQSTTNFRNGENTIAFTGLRVGRVTKIGKLPLNLFLASWYTPVHEGAVGKWNIKLSPTFLFPK